jgi:hypothetical protein
VASEAELIELRYHVASLVAVFLALAVGILIGSSMVGTPSVESQIRRLKSGFDRIQAEDRRLRAENEELRGQARLLENALRQTVPAVVQGRLAERRIGLIITGQGIDASLVRETKYLLATAGASVGSITTLQGPLLPENPNSRQIILTRSGIDTQDTTRAERQLAARITRAIVRGNEPDLLRVIGEFSPGLALDGDYALPIDAVTLIAGDATEEQAQAMSDGTSIQARIADVLREEGIAAVACERAECPLSLMAYFARYSLTTVDSLDTAVGKIALVLALAGKQGHYGTKPSAAQVLPDLDLEPMPRGESPARSLPRAPQEPGQPRESLLLAPGRSGRGRAGR